MGFRARLWSVLLVFAFLASLGSVDVGPSEGQLDEFVSERGGESSPAVRERARSSKLVAAHADLEVTLVDVSLIAPSIEVGLVAFAVEQGTLPYVRGPTTRVRGPPALT
jgi:hypothetical protein